jgi:hypothetical protein
MQLAGETEIAQRLFAAAASLEKAGDHLAELSDEIGR